MIRIAIATLAVTMIVGPIVAMGAAPANQPSASTQSTPVPASQDEVVALAKSQGLVRLSTVALQNGVWILHGAARNGALIEVDISSTGEVLNPVS